MLRTPVLVRDATEEDAGVLAALWQELLARPGGAELVGGPPETTTSQAVERCDNVTHTRLVVAEVDGQVAGGAFFRVGVASPLHDERALHISHLQVDPEFMRHGVGQSLVEAAVTWAEQLGIGMLLAAASVTDRDANRFLARLGLTQVAVLRGASVAALRTRLPHDPSAVARSGVRMGRSVGQVVAARRSQRRARGRDAVT